MENVQITLINNQLKASFTAENFDWQWESWKRKLHQLACLYQVKPEVFFRFPKLPNQRLIECINEMKNECFILGIENEAHSFAEFKIIQQRLRGGESIVIENGALIVGNIEKDVEIILKKGNLYNLGCIKGRIECLDENSAIVCQKMDHAKISFQGKWHISTKNEDIVYYDKSSSLEDEL